MKKLKLLCLLAVALLCVQGVSAQTENPQAVSSLLDRIGGSGTSDRFVTIVDESLSTDGNDVFVITSSDGKPCIKGNTLSAVTTGINWYLNYYLHVNLTWNNLTTDLSGGTLPVPSTEEQHESTADYRYYLNYCTFSYSMAFWTWERWQQEIDWMALHGVNMPLVIVGLETVWKNLLMEEYGYTMDEVNDFVAGPGFMAWFAMNNMQAWGSTGAGIDGNPEWWYERQAQLASQILTRMRELGMSPVLPGFSGMIPDAMASKQSDWSIVENGTWCRFTRPDILNPADTDNFNSMASLYYKHLEAIMGVSEFYSMDPFHEASVPSGTSISDVYNGVMEALDAYAYATADASELSALSTDKPRWIVQYWQGLPAASAFDVMDDNYSDRFIALDLFSDVKPNWSGSYYNNCEFIYCMLHNFGGRTGLYGRMEAVIGGYYDALAKSTMKGIGATPEGIETNPMLYDLLFELPWRSEMTAAEWLSEYAYNRYGVQNDAAYSAWLKLLESVYACNTSQQGTSEPIVCARPAWSVSTVSSWSTAAIYWDVQDVLAAADLLLSVGASSDNANYRYDVIETVRQSMVDFAYYLLPDVKKAYDSGDTAEYERLYSLFLALISDLDAMLANDENFSLGHWTTMARGITDEAASGYTTSDTDKNWLEWNVRTQVTVWGPQASADGGGLHDYSNRCWAGLLKDFHYERWKYFFENNGGAPSSGWFAWEESWTNDFTVSYSAETTDNAVEVARTTFNKYFGVLTAADGTKYYFPYGVSRDARESIVSEAYRGNAYSLPLTLKNGVTVQSVWIDLNADLAQTDDETLAVTETSVTIPDDAVIGRTKAVVSLSDGTELLFDVAVREIITDPRTVSVSTDDSAMGTVAISGSDATSVTNTDPVTVAATANSGYNFYRWVDADGNVMSSDNPYTYYAKEAVSLVAEFVVDKWGVPTENTGDMGDISSYEQYVSSITFTHNGREGEAIYEASECPASLFNTVPQIVNVARGSGFTIDYADTDKDGLKYCYLSAYIDLNADGDFDDEGELLKVVGTHGATNSAVCAGSISVLLPYDMPLGITHMRLRFDGAWTSGYSSETNAYPAKNALNRMCYEVVLNVTEYSDIASQITVASNNGEWGTVYLGLSDLPPGSTPTTLSVASGLKYTLNAVASEGAEFLYWKDSYGRTVSTEAVYEMYAAEDGTFTAYFRKSIVIGGWEIQYEINGNEMTLTQIVSSGDGELVIPSTITVDGVDYSVVAFANGLFTGNTALTQVTLPATLAYVGDNTVAEGAMTGTASSGTGTTSGEYYSIYNLSETLVSSDGWTVEISGITDGSTYNQWGSGLFATGTNPLGTSYSGGFQFYLAASGNIVMKVGGGTEYSLDNSNCTIASGTSFKAVVKYDGNGTVDITVTNGSGVVGSKSVSATMSDISAFSAAIPSGIDLSFTVRAGDVADPFSGCSNLEAIAVADGNTNFVSTDGVLYESDGTTLVSYPAGKDAAPYKKQLVALIEKTANLVDLVADVTPDVDTNLTLQTTDGNGDFYIYTNAPETTEGAIANLVDGNNETFFHSNWSSGTAPSDGLDHHLTVNLGEGNEVSKFKFSYVTRHNAQTDYPKTINVYGSTDGNDFTLLATVPGEGENALPTSTRASYESAVMGNGTAYRYLRFMVTATNSGKKADGHVFFHMAEFDLIEVSSTADVKTAYEDCVTDETAASAYDATEAARSVYGSYTSVDELQAAYTALKTKYDALLDAVNGALPFRLTDDAASPALYIMLINRSATAALAYDAGTAQVAVASSYNAADDTQAWYFMPVDGGIAVLPYTASGAMLATNNFSEGAGMVSAVTDTDGYGYTWNVTVIPSSTWYNISIDNGSGTMYYFSNYGGTSNKMGFYNSNTSSDGGSMFRFMPYGMSDAYYTLYNYKAGLAAEVVAGTTPGTVSQAVADEYNTAYADAAVLLDAMTATDAEYTEAYNTLVAANEALTTGFIPSHVVEDGKAYRLLGRLSDGTLRHIVRDGASLKWASAKDESENSVFIAQSAGSDGVFSFVSAVADCGWAYGAGMGTEHAAIMVSTEGTVAGTYTFVGVSGSNYRTYSLESNGSIGYYTRTVSNIYKSASTSVTTDLLFEEATDYAGFDVTVNAGSTGNYATLNLPFATTIPEGVSACSVALSDDGTALDVTELIAAGAVLPANTPVLLSGTSGNYRFVPAQAASASYSTGLQGTLAASAVDATAYILAYTDGEGSEIKFFLLSDSNIVNANKAYYALASGQTAIRSIRLNSGFTAIDGISAGDELRGVIYDVTGRRVKSASAPGVYIVNGKKVLVK